MAAPRDVDDSAAKPKKSRSRGGRRKKPEIEPGIEAVEKSYEDDRPDTAAAAALPSKPLNPDVADDNWLGPVPAFLSVGAR